MSKSKLIYYRDCASKLIPYAVAASRRLRPKTRLEPLRLTNVGNEAASVSFDNSYNGGATILQYRREEQQAFVDWNLSAITIAPGEYVEFVGENYNTQGFLGKYTVTGDAVAASGNIMSLIYGAYTTRDALVIPEGITFGGTEAAYISNLDGMFANCTCLTTAPKLPATTLTNKCYTRMFAGCTSLTVAPELPATTLTNKCYMQLFSFCTSLTIAPKLPATTLTYRCYDQMFTRCVRLETISVRFIEWSRATLDWVRDVSDTGVFTCPSELDTTQRGVDYIPEGWTIVPV